MPTKLTDLDNGLIMIENVLLGGCSLFKPTAYEAGQKEKYNASVIFEPTDPTFLELKNRVHAIVMKLNDNKVPPIYKSCIIDGNTRKADYYHGKMTLSASTLYPVQVFDQARNLVNDDKAVFPGCIINIIISFWEDTKKRTAYANLNGVQLVQQGERLSGGGVDTTNFFQALSDEDLLG